MRAAWYERQGPADEVFVVGELPDPQPGPGELLVQIATSGVNPSDTNLRAGRYGRKMPGPRVVPHNDGAGTVVAVGEGVGRDWIGQRVWVHNAQRGARVFGTAAQYVAIEQELAARLPDNTDFLSAASLSVPCMTAYVSLLRDGPIDGQTVLVTGGAGSVGHYAVQLARWSGARVIATVSSPLKAQHALAAGADCVIDYKREPVAQRIMEFTGGVGVDRIVEVDFGANLPVTLEVLKPNGVVAMYSSVAVPVPQVPVLQLMFKAATVHFIQLGISPLPLRRMAQEGIQRWLETGKAQHRIAAAFPLAEIAAAHAAVERGDKLGMVVVTL